MSDPALTNIIEILDPQAVEIKRKENNINEANRLAKIINMGLSSSLEYPVHIKLDKDSSPSKLFFNALKLLLPGIRKHYIADFSPLGGAYLIIRLKSDN